MIYLKICIFICISLLSFKGLYFLLSIFQEEHYHPRSFLNCLYTFYLKKIYNYFLCFSIIIFLFNNPYLYILCALFCFVGEIFKDKLLMKLKVTKRIIRLLITYMLFFIISLIFLKDLKLLSLLYLLNPFLIILANFINTPIEMLINNYYISFAKKKLKSTNSLVKIAITGSYGKTSTKNIITSILEEKYITCKTPKSYNTIMGITKVINTQITKSTEVFVCEMGASKQGEIYKMSTLIKPHISIITDVGLQHISTFKTLKNVLNAKFELLNTNYDNSINILNCDNELIKEKGKDYQNVIYYGLNNESDVCAKNITIYRDKTTFDIYEKDMFVITIKTQLLGLHNIKNILASYSVIKALRKHSIFITNEEFQKALLNIPQTKHRLSYEKIGNIHLYDDSFSSNLEGLKNSILVLDKVPFKKVIITPGIVDGGPMTKKLNQEVASLIKDKFNEIYIIDSYSGRYIYNELKDLDNIYLFNSFKLAYDSILKKNKEEIAILIENDLPDNYLIRRKKNG